MTADEIRREVSKISWFHTIDLGRGIVTPGLDATPNKLQAIGLPARLNGMSVLDVGAWDGFFSFEAERRGANRVLATDHFCWNGPGWGSKAGFELGRAVLGSRVEDLEIDVLDLDAALVGTFDLVLFLGVLYHMRHPLLALERVASVTHGLLILETHLDLLDYACPAMAFYAGSELHGDHTNWCGPNVPMVIAMLETVGFTDVKVHWGPTPYPDHEAHARAVFHARRAT